MEGYLVKKFVYLNNAATSFPKPAPVVAAVAGYMESVPFHNARTGIDILKEDAVASARQKLASLFNVADPNRIIFTSGSTESLNMAILGLELADGDHVVTTSIEHNSVLRPLKTLEKEKGIRLSIVGCDHHGRVEPQMIIDEITPQTRAVVVNHGSNVTGEVIDIGLISPVLRSEGIVVIVDASQTAGAIPIDAEAMGVDILAFTGHKSLMGLPGCGGMVIREGKRLKPLKTGGTGVRSDFLFQPTDLPMYYEAGTQNLPGIISMGAGVDFIQDIGQGNIRHKKEKLYEKMVAGLENIDKIEIFSRLTGSERIPLLCFNVRGVDPAEVGYILENSYGIITRSGLHCAPLIHQVMGTFPRGSVRISPSYFTTFGEVELLIEALKTVSRELGE